MPWLQKNFSMFIFCLQTQHIFQIFEPPSHSCSVVGESEDMCSYNKFGNIMQFQVGASKTVKKSPSIERGMTGNRLVMSHI